MGQLYYCRGGAAHVSPFADWNKFLHADSGSRYSQIVGTIAAESFLYGGYITQAGVPNSTFWETDGTWSIEVEQDGSFDTCLGQAQVLRLDSAGNILQTGAYTAQQTLPGSTQRTFTMTCPIWTWGEENSGNLFAVRVAIYNPEVGAATDFKLFTNTEEVNTGLTENKRGDIYTDTVTTADDFRTCVHFSDTVTVTDPTVLPTIVGTYTDTVTTADDFRTCVHLTDRVYVNDVAEEDNYSPLKDPKPGAISPGWQSGGAKSTKAWPISDVGYDANKWRPFPGGTGTWWQQLDNDVDLTDTTDGVSSLQVLPPYWSLGLGFTGLQANWGIVEDVTFRIRTTIAACDSGNGTIWYVVGLYVGGVLLTSDDPISVIVDPAGVTNEIYSATYTGVNLNVLEFNTITASFGYLCKNSGGVNVSLPVPFVYAVDLIASRGAYEKVISEDSWGAGKPSASSGWGANDKAITADSWSGKQIPGGSGWIEKE